MAATNQNIGGVTDGGELVGGIEGKALVDAGGGALCAVVQRIVGEGFGGGGLADGADFVGALAA